MCLAVPGKLIEQYEKGGLRMGKVQFGGIAREACLEYLPESAVGDYVLVHVGFAITKVDEEEAHRTYELLQQMGELEQLEAAAGEFGGEGQP